MVGLKVELVECRKELGDGAHALVGHVDAIVDGQGHQARMQAGPQPLLRDLVAANDLQLVETLEELQQRLQSSVRDVAASEDQAVDALAAMREILDEVEHIRVVGVQETEGVEAAALQGLEVVLLHLLARRDHGTRSFG